MNNVIREVGPGLATFSVYNVSTNDAGNYNVIITNGAGSVTSSNASLTVLVPPTITTGPVDQGVVQGSNATFCVAAASSLPLSYQWWFNGTNLLVGATNACFSIIGAQLTNGGIILWW